MTPRRRAFLGTFGSMIAASRRMDQQEKHMTTTHESELRKLQPVGTIVTSYFPRGLRAVAAVAAVGNFKHSPDAPVGAPPVWVRSKSFDHDDALVRHLQDGAGWDRMVERDGRAYEVLHAAEAAWRALARLELIIEANGGEVVRIIELGAAHEPVGRFSDTRGYSEDGPHQRRS